MYSSWFLRKTLTLSIYLANKLKRKFVNISFDYWFFCFVNNKYLASILIFSKMYFFKLSKILISLTPSKFETLTQCQGAGMWKMHFLLFNYPLHCHCIFEKLSFCNCRKKIISWVAHFLETEPKNNWKFARTKSVCT